MKKAKTNSGGSKIVIACLVSWGLSLLLLASPSVLVPNLASLPIALLPITLMAAAILTIPAAIVVARGLSTLQAKDERFISSPLAKTLAALLVACLVVSTFTAIKSLWCTPLQPNWGNRFIYENIATGTGFAAIALTFILSALQRDIYWTTRSKKALLDERQLQQRRAVFETSYKLAFFLVLAAAFVFSQTVHNVPAIMDNNAFNTVPGHLSWPGYNVVIALFALPLVVAAWKKR